MVCAAVPDPLPILEPVEIWKEFPRQQMAFDYACSCRQDVAIFAYESAEFSRPGQRRYLVTTYYNFGKRYLTMKSPKHYYEVIPDYSACNLYFDIEFMFAYNQQHTDCASSPSTTQHLLDVFIQYICCQLQCCFSITCDRTSILDLESSTKEKFSRHLIFKLKRTAFKNNICAGVFVKAACDQLRKMWSHSCNLETKQDVMKLLHTCMPCGRNQLTDYNCSCPPVKDLISLFVLNGKGQRVLICDEGVYTRNRNFRLFLSTKLGKSAKLTIAKENKFKTEYGENPKRPKWSRCFNNLLDSLVCNVRFESCPRILDPCSSEGTQSGQRLLGKRPRHSLDTDNSSRVLQGPDSAHPVLPAGDESGTASEGRGPSPYPALDRFITSQLNKGGIQGRFRRWTFFPEGKTLVYDVLDYRWCENIGRHHKSNNIIIVVVLCDGVYYQKCHDPDCKRINFRSQGYPIPAHVDPIAANSTHQQEPMNLCFQPIMTSSPLKQDDHESANLVKKPRTLFSSEYEDIPLTKEEADSFFDEDDADMETSDRVGYSSDLNLLSKEIKPFDADAGANEFDVDLKLSEKEIESFFESDKDDSSSDDLNLTQEEIDSFFASEEEEEEKEEDATAVEGCHELNLSKEEMDSFVESFLETDCN